MLTVKRSLFKNCPPPAADPQELVKLKKGLAPSSSGSAMPPASSSSSSGSTMYAPRQPLLLGINLILEATSKPMFVWISMTFL